MFICIGIPRNTWQLSLFQVQNVYSHFLSFSFLGTRRERQNLYYANCFIWPNKRAAHPVDPKWAGLAQAQKSTRFVQRQISTNCFLKNHQNSQTLASGHDVLHTQSHFQSGVFIMTFVIVTSSAREYELHSMCAPACALCRIVLSLTKPNEKI